MSAASLFSILNTFALVCWLMLLIAPGTVVVRQFIRNLLAPAILSLAYLVIVVFKFGQAEGGFDSLANVMLLFRDPWAATAGWTHFLAFDLFVGVWIVNDSDPRRISRWLITPCLIATFMLGPIGLLGYLVVRAVASRSIPLAGFIKDFYRSSFQREPILARTGLILLGLGGLSLVLAAVDPTVVDDTRVWLKPFKFYLSIGIYMFTIAWLLGDISAYLSDKYIRFFVWYSVAMAAGELGIITLQAARGVRSHYNTDSTLDIALYGVMGLLIFINMFVVAHFGSHWWRNQKRLHRHYWLGGMYGIGVFTITGLLACVMSSQPWSRIGLYDSHTLVPLFGWNNAGGDLRISHFLGIHALQMMPILGWYCRKEGASIFYVHAAGILLGVTVIGLFTAAILGLPVLS